MKNIQKISINLMAPIYFGILFSIVSIIFWDKLKNLIGLSSLKIIIFTSIALILSSIFFFALMKKNIKNKWFFLAIFFSVFLLMIGVIFIGLTLERPNLNSKLWENGEVTYNKGIVCYSESGNYKIDDYIYCIIKNPKLKSFNITIMQENPDSNFLKITDLENSIYLYGDENTKYIRFQIYGIDKNNNIRYLEVYRKFSFLTEDQSDKLNENILKYFLGLIVIIFFSVPPMINNLKNLYREK